MPALINVLLWLLAAPSLAAAAETRPATVDALQAAIDSYVDAKLGGQATAAADTRPTWVEAAPQLVDDAYQMSIVVGPYATRAECDAQMPEALQTALGRYVDACLGGQATGRIRLPEDYLRREVVKEQWAETRPYSVGPMVQLHVLLRFDRTVKDCVLEEHRQAIIARRLWVIGLGMVGGLVCLATVYGYLRTTGVKRNDAAQTANETPGR